MVRSANPLAIRLNRRIIGVNATIVSERFNAKGSRRCGSIVPLQKLVRTRKNPVVIARPAIKRCIRFAVLALSISTPIAYFSALPAYAQTAAAGTVAGTVTDLAGKALGDARVTITSATFSTSVLSGPDGTFAVSVPPDTYSVSARANGFQLFRQDGITVLADQRTKVKFALANVTLTTIGQTSTSSATSLNRSTSATASVSSQTFVDQGQNQVLNVLDQIPGVEINRFSSNAPGANSSISIRGAQPYESQILIDGHPVTTSANGAYGFNATFLNALLLSGVDVDKGPGALPNTVEDAVGGTLNFKTADITSGPTASALVGYDSYNGSYFSLKAADTFGKLGVLVGIADNATPGYLGDPTVYGGATYPKVGAGEAYIPKLGVLNFGYKATQEFESRSQLGKLSYNFSPQTSIVLSQYSTQTNNDETGTNYEYVNATIVPCIDTPPAGFVGTPNCTEAGGKNPNYTNGTLGNKVGTIQPINLYAPYPNTTEFDNEPIYSAEFRTVVGPGSLLARYYTGAINRTITQGLTPNIYSPCVSPACPESGDEEGDGLPYVENTIDILHGIDGQYTVPFGNDYVTAGFDRHVDSATYGSYDPAEGPPTFNQNVIVQSLSYSLRGSFRLTPKLTLESGNYLSSTSYVGTRFDPRDGIVYSVTPNVLVRASYGSAYVAPYYDILNPSTYVHKGTLNLATASFKPETSSGYDLGTDVKVDRNTRISGDIYLTNIFNRYASVTSETSGTFGGENYTMITQNGNQANVREEGVELQVLRAPKVGFGFHSAVDILRDYAYNQNPNVSVESIFSAGTPGNYVQLPGYPYSKIRNDVFYSFGNGSQTRLSSTSYGQNNAFGEFDGEVRLPLKGALILNLGCTNILNHDDYQAAGIYNGGPTYPELGGGSGYTTLYFVQPRTLYVQLQRNIGPNGTQPLPRTSL
jgi:outer membrane receptor protein involved in Fe transport